MQFEVLVAVLAHLFKIDGRVLGGMQLGVLVQVLFCGVTVRVFGHLGGRTQGECSLECWC